MIYLQLFTLFTYSLAVAQAGMDSMTPTGISSAELFLLVLVLTLPMFAFIAMRVAVNLKTIIEFSGSLFQNYETPENDGNSDDVIPLTRENSDSDENKAA